MSKQIRVENLTKSAYKNGSTFEILNGISFSIKENEIVSLVGPSGCGKTTILNILSGLDETYEGFCEDTLSEQRIAFMFQETALFPWRTVQENLLLPMEIAESVPDALDHISFLLNQVGLGDHERDYPDQLSGGMKRRAYLAQSLIYRPHVLFLDEPFTGLDYETRKAMQTVLLQRAESFTIVMATHDIEDAILLSDRVFVLTNRPATIKSVVDVSSIQTRGVDYVRMEESLYSLLDAFSAKNR